MTERRSENPRDRMGVYKRLDDVPRRYRLERFARAYEGRDVWTEWSEIATEEHQSARYAQLVDRAGRSWKSHVEERGRHHALARPEDVDRWFEKVLERCKPLSAYQIYLTKLEAFYTWLQFHAEHPHVYHPVWMAAATCDATATVWDAKMARRDS